MRIALAQLNPTVGDIEGNAGLIRRAAEHAAAEGAEVILLPELCVLGYPPRDLLLRECVVTGCEKAVRSLAGTVASQTEPARPRARSSPQTPADPISGAEPASFTPAPTIIVGHPRPASRGRKPAHNAASVIRGGEIIAVYDKQMLPGYDVFDEDRYFEPGRTNCTLEIAGRRCGVLICEDIWRGRDVEGSQALRPRIERDLVAEAAEAGCEIIFVLSASPFVAGKGARHVRQLRETARAHNIAIALVNQAGANDDLIFDGRSILIDRRGEIVHQCAAFEDDLAVIDLAFDGETPAPPGAVSRSDDARLEDEPAREGFSRDPSVASSLRRSSSSPDARCEEMSRALVLGIRDYVRKTGHARVTIGLSGGIDSALTATLAAAAIGAENITGVKMPSRYSSPGSLSDADALAHNLGIERLHEIPIERAHRALQETLSSRAAEGEPQLPWKDGVAGVTDENIQARVRCILLMAISNTDGSLVLAPGNKSELAMGYCTLYGDMAGALAPLGDVLKTEIYDLARWINRAHRSFAFKTPPIPEASITKPPSAELKPDQTDQDTLPPYETLDEIIRRHVNGEESVETIIQRTGFDAELVRGVARTIDLNEYKRMQAAIVLKVSPRAFGPGRPMPVAMRWRGEGPED